VELDVFRDAGGKWRWRLKSEDGHTVATSGQPFFSRWGARTAGRNFVAKAGRYEFSVYRDKAGAHRWRARAANGKNVAASPGPYETEAAARQAADTVQAGAKEEEPVPEQPPAQQASPVGGVSTWLAGGLAVVGSAVGIVGLADTDIDRAVVNHPVVITVAFVLILAGVLSGVASPLFHGHRGAALVGVLMFGIGLFILVLIAAQAKSASDRPRVSASLNKTASGLNVVGTVDAAGLETDQHVFVRVVGISTDDKLADAHVGHPRAGEKPLDRQPVYSSRTGASSDGTAQVKMNVPVGAGLYERLDVEAVVSDDRKKPITGEQTDSCDQETSNIGCESLMVPPTARRPRLAAQWRLPAAKPPILTVKARMDDLSSDDRVLLSVRRVRAKQLGGRVYGAAWAPDATGAVQEAIAIPVAARGKPVCIVMRSLRGSSRFASESRERFGPCRPRSRGMAVQVGPPPQRP
jgi:uncharacterized protein YegP (UPF0339 family)